MAKILITGSNGQLGSELQKLSKNTSYDFVFTDIDTLDITDYPSLEKYCLSHHFEIIVNCAAYTAVDKAESEPDKAYAINCTAVKNLVKVASKLDATLIQISTDYAFDGMANTPYTETDSINPLSVYGKTKTEGEKEALLYNKSIIIRTAWLYSTFGNNIVKTILKLSKERNSLGFVFDQTGTPTYAEDLAKAILKIIENTLTTSVKPGIYHYSNEGVCSWYDVAYEIVNYTKNKNCSIKPIQTHEYPTPAKRPSYSVLNKLKIRNTFGIEIPYWRESLHKCLDSLTNNN
jgi:dTDP-4-dehydrorhamnose reductase